MTEKFDSLTEKLARAEPGTPVHTALTRARAIEGRKIARASDGALGWCAWHQALEDADLFIEDTRTKTGLRTYCVQGESEYKASRREGGERPTPKALEREPSKPDGTHKCRKCGGRFNHVKKKSTSTCPACRVHRRGKKG